MSASLLRRTAAWGAPLALVPALMAGAVTVSLPDEEGAELLALHPLDIGTTWVYEVRNDGQPSGTRTRQVTSQAGIEGEVLDAAVLRSSYTDYPGQGRVTSAAYLEVTDDRILQHGVYQDGEYLRLEPPGPVYEMPLTGGASWDHEGTVGEVGLRLDATLVAVEDVEVAGHTFTECRHYRSTSTYSYSDGSMSDQQYEEWACPGYGPVRMVTTNEGSGLELVEELREFHTPSTNWYAEEPTSTADEAVAGSTHAFDAARTAAVPHGTVVDRLTWSDTRSVALSQPPVADGETLVVGEEDGEVSGTALSDGEVRWRLRLTGPIVAPLTIAGGSVLVADAAKNLWALRTTDGTAAWAHEMDDVVSAAPVANATHAFVATDDGRVTAIDLARGDVAWRAYVGARARSALAMVEDRVVVGDPAEGQVTALDPGDGDIVWQTSIDGALEAGPAIADGRVLVADDGGVVHGLDVADGSTDWQVRTGRQLVGDFAVGGDLATVLADDARLVALRLDDGSPAWTRPLPPTTASPVVVGDQVVTVATDGTVEVRALSDGRRSDAWMLPASGLGATSAVEVPLALAGDSLVVTAGSDAEGVEATLFAYPVTGEAADAAAGVSFSAEVRPVPATPAAPAVLVDGNLYVPGDDHTLYRSTPGGEVEAVLTSKGLQPGVTVHEGMVIAQRDSEIQALPLDGGEPLWRFPATEPYIGSIPSAHGDTVFVPEYGLGLAAVALDGTPRWFTPISNAIGTSPPLPLPDGDVVYGSGTLARYDGDTGQPVWSMEDAQLFSSAAHADGVVVADVIRNVHGSGLHALDAEDGRVLWSHRNDRTQIVAGPAVGEGVVVYGDAQGLVTAFDLVTGETLWDLQLSTPMAGPPVISGSRVYLSERGRDHDLFQREYRISAHDLRTGMFRGSFQPPGQSYTTTPAIGSTSNGTLLVPSNNRLGGIVMILEPRP